MITDLGTLGGPNSSVGFVSQPNDTGLITGNAQINTVAPLAADWGSNFGWDAFGDPCAGAHYEVRVFAGRNGVIHALPTLGGNNALAFGGANDRGQLVGTAEKAVPNCAPHTLEQRPVIWGLRLGEIHELPLPPGNTVGGSTAINDKGQIVGVGRLRLAGIPHGLARCALAARRLADRPRKSRRSRHRNAQSRAKGRVVGVRPRVASRTVTSP